MVKKEEALEVEGTVTQALANTRFRVQLETGVEVMAHVAGRMRKNFIRIVPGDKVRVQLAGRAKLRLTLLDPEGEPVTRYRLGVRTTEPFMATDVVELLPAGAPPPLGGMFEGQLPGAVEVTLDVEGYPEWRGEVRGLRDDTVVDLHVQLSRPRPLAGRVVHADGRSAANGTIEVTRGRVAGHGDPGIWTSTAIDVDGPALRALEAGLAHAAGRRGSTIVRRNLMQHPLSPKELAAFDTVVFDPPRAGAEALSHALAASTVPRIAGWIVQRYSTVPTLLNCHLKVSPVSSPPGPLSNDPPVTVCGALSSLRHSIAWPFWTRISGGL